MNKKTKMYLYIILVIVAISSLFSENDMLTKVGLIVCFLLFGMITFAPNKL